MPMKRKISLLLVSVLLLSALCALSGCAATPKVEDLYDRVVYLIEESSEINTVIYGPGLPLYERETEYCELNRVYFGFMQKDQYEYVRAESKFQSVDEIKARAEKVYSSGFLNDVVYKTLFEGYAIEDGAGGAAYGLARYQELSGRFCTSVNEDETGRDENILYTNMRVYDYSTMEILSLGREDASKVKMDSWTDDAPDAVESIEISLIFERGQWYLDSFAGA